MKYNKIQNEFDLLDILIKLFGNFEIVSHKKYRDRMGIIEDEIERIGFKNGQSLTCVATLVKRNKIRVLDIKNVNSNSQWNFIHIVFDESGFVNKKESEISLV